MPLNFGSITDASYEADLEPEGHELLLSSPNPRALIPNANFAPMSGVKKASLCTDSIATATPVPKVLLKLLAARLKLKHSVVLNSFATRQRAKHHCVLKAKSP